jgi:6-pyruvoyltetrahydropterin/6-carboxytetrahydropterin synthase
MIRGHEITRTQKMHTEPAPTRLQRTARFSINPDGSTQGQNNFAGTPAFSGLARFYELTLGVMGVPDRDTGYLVGIQDLDRIVREHLVPVIARACRDEPTTEPASLLPDLWEAASELCPHPLTRIYWHLSPYYGVEMTAETHQTGRIHIAQQFEFAAAHRLHTQTLSEEQNQQFFGKCNNPSGHGHNYRIEPMVSIPVDQIDRVNTQGAIQDCVNRTLLDHLDHKYLNTDCEWFDQSKGGLIPSVEHIARVCYEQLAPAIESLGHGMQLVRLQAWETEKTSAIYPG